MSSGNPSDCGTQFNIYTGGRSNLKPESSDNLTLGMMLDPSSTGDLNTTSAGSGPYAVKAHNQGQNVVLAFYPAAFTPV